MLKGRYYENGELILELENELLKPEVKKLPEKLRNLLSEDFIEYCSTGEIYNYNINDTFYEDDVSFELIDFSSRELADDCILATYKIIKTYHSNKIIKKSIRSSIWKFYDNKWKMVFHQGTLIY